jgi:DNA polymerase-3 subunit alpha
LAGYDPGEADMIRKAVGKKKKKLIDKHRSLFIRGAENNGYSREVCEAIWGDIEYFARYGFNKSHAADYAKVTCQTAFLKAHYPVEYLAAMLSVERDNTDKVRRYFAEAKNLRIEIAPPDINRSMLDFTIEDDAERPVIRFGLGAVKNAGEGAIQILLDEREANGVFANLQELCERLDLRRVGRRALEYMIKARSFDSWGTPAQVLDALDRMMSYSGSTHDAAAVGQMSLFGGSSAAMEIDLELLRPEAEVDEVEHKQLLEWEKEALGVHVSEHPLERPLAVIAPQTNASIIELDQSWNGKAVKLAGIIGQLRTHTTRKGDPMAFATLEDLDGKVDVIFFPRTWKEYRMEIKVDQVMLVTGKVQADEDDLTIIADRVQTKIEHASMATAPATSRDVTAVTDSQAPAAPTDQVQEKAPVYQAPPWEDDVPADNEPPTPGRQAPPPPPPTWEDDNQWEPAPRPRRAHANTGNGRRQAGNGRSSPRKLQGPHRIHVEVEPGEAWQNIFREVLAVSKRYPGEGQLTISLAGQGLTMAFPDQITQFGPEMAAALSELPGVLRIRAESTEQAASGS